ncbi:hypothetical protein J4730_02395 [Klebsiella pneumoniae]|uniref:Uncharacterized protein n=1 Tax=Klebsiella pneumoniae TaxID=573 RepID=A0A939SUJ0_KLEPN|nr:hypothetical protein [Klebsiella pneumoniae]
MSLGAGRAQGGKSPPPLYPGSGQQHRRCAVPSTYPCRLRVGPRQRPCKHGPQPASMRAAPAFRERLSDVEAASTGSFSSPGPAVIWGCRPGKAQPPPGEIKDTVPDILPGGAALARAYGV